MRVKSMRQGEVKVSGFFDSTEAHSATDSQVLYVLENNLLAVRGELLSEIGIDRHRESGMLDPGNPSDMLSSLMSHDREVDEMIREGKKWRLLEVSLLKLGRSEWLLVCVRSLCNLTCAVVMEVSTSSFMLSINTLRSFHHTTLSSLTPLLTALPIGSQLLPPIS
jgi:hypothetical protein